MIELRKEVVKFIKEANELRKEVIQLSALLALSAVIEFSFVALAWPVCGMLSRLADPTEIVSTVGVPITKGYN